MKYEKWSLGYWLARPFVVFAHWLIYRKIVVVGKNKIPKGKPLVFAGNHQNALSDDIAIVCCLPTQPVWLGRAGLFDVKFTRPILRFLKIMPVYRIRDGKDTLGKNDEVFGKAITVLENKGTIALYPEAAHSFKRQMLPHKKGIPRIVFLAEEKNGFKLDIKIVPVGIYFSHYWHIGSKLLLMAGDPISVNDYRVIYEENPPRAALKLRDDLYNAIRDLTIDIRSKTYYEEFEQIREIAGRAFLKKTGKKGTFLNRFYAEKELIKILEKAEKEQPVKISILSGKVSSYTKILKNLKIRDWLMAEKSAFGKMALNLAVLLITLPVSLFGFIMNFIPFFFLDRIIRKKVKNQAFWSTFFFAAGLLLFPLVYAAELFFAAPLLPGIWSKALFLAGLPLAGKASYIWYIGLLKSSGRIRLLRLRTFHRALYYSLVSQRKEITDGLTDLTGA